MWKSWMMNTCAYLLPHRKYYYLPNSWKFQTAFISLNISRPLNPIKHKSSPYLRYICSFRSVTLVMGVTLIGSATPKLWYILPTFYAQSKVKWFGLSTDIVLRSKKDLIMSQNDEIWSFLDFFQEKIKKSWLNCTKFLFTPLYRAQFYKYKNLT